MVRDWQSLHRKALCGLESWQKRKHEVESKVHGTNRIVMEQSVVSLSGTAKDMQETISTALESTFHDYKSFFLVVIISSNDMKMILDDALIYIHSNKPSMYICLQCRPREKPNSIRKPGQSGTKYGSSHDIGWKVHVIM